MIDMDKPELIEKVLVRSLDYAIRNPDLDLPDGKLILTKGSMPMGNGIKLSVYSNDHGTHFHIIHKGRNIDARFDYPSFKFKNYKSPNNTFTSKELRAVEGQLASPLYSKFVEAQLDKRN